jgi:redox-sensing transcriptional repressor
LEVKGISQATLKRLPVYFTYLKSLSPHGPANISATAIAAALDMGEVQVRKDLASVSKAGRPKVGYAVVDLIHELEAFLGYDDVTDAVIVGAGKLGRALLDYGGFSEYGLNIVAGFDIKESLEGETEGGKSIFGLSRFSDLCRRLNIRIGIITVPAESAQAACDLMVENGIVAILNFAPVHLKVPEGVLLQNENIAASLAGLSNRLLEQISREEAES